MDVVINEPFRCAQSLLEAKQSSPCERVSKQEDLLVLADALPDLPDDQRDAVILRHLQGLSLADVAHELGRTEAAVPDFVHCGLSRLHDLLNDRE